MTITIMLMEERPDSCTCLLEYLRDISQHGRSFLLPVSGGETGMIQWFRM